MRIICGRTNHRERTPRELLERDLTARHRREVFRVEDLLEADLRVLLAGEMDPTYDYLDAELG